MFLANLKDHLTGLTRFSGRERPGQFWPWVACVIALMMAGTMAAMIPVMIGTFGKIQTFAAEHPELTTVDEGPGHYSIHVEGYHPELMPDFGAMMTGMSLVTAIVVVLLAAAVVRRLHDCGRTGAWGLMPLPFLATGFILMPRAFAHLPPDMTLFLTIFINNMIYLLALVLLIILLVGESEPGENRHGPPIPTR